MNSGLLIVEAARKYIGTPFVRQGRIRGGGIDCSGLVVCAIRDAGLGDLDDEHLRSATILGERAGRNLWEDLMEKHSGQFCNPGAGAVAIIRIKDRRYHCGILNGVGGIIHTALRYGVVEIPLGVWATKLVACLKMRPL